MKEEVGNLAALEQRILEERILRKQLFRTLRTRTLRMRILMTLSALIEKQISNIT